MNRDKVNIFAIDDEKELRELYESVLSPAFMVTPFASPVEALTAIDNGCAPTAFLTDLMMPQMNGIKLVQELRKRKIQRPVVVVSAHTDKDNALKALELGVFAMVEKPFNNRQLLGIMKQAALSGLQEELITELLQRYKGMADNMREFLQSFRFSFAAAVNETEAHLNFKKKAGETQNLLEKLEEDLSVVQIQYDNLGLMRSFIEKDQSK